MKCSKLRFCGLIFMLSFLVNAYSLNISRDNCPVTIFYGLNESHSNDWAQATNNSLIGISYYDKNNQNLIYRSINTNGQITEEIVHSGNHLEINIILFDSSNQPHIFVATSNELNQQITHYYKQNGTWLNEVIYNFSNDTGEFIYELSGDIDSNNQFHLLILKSIYNPDSENYYMAFADAHLFYLSNSSSSWQSELIYNYNTIWTLDEYSKMMNRQDIKVDSNNKAHIIFGEQINAMSSFSPSRLCYAKKINNEWIIETAFTYNAGTRDDAGWFPSIDIDQNNHPSIACCYIARVSSGSSISAKLYLLTRTDSGVWISDLVCDEDDGYYGSDGRNYTGALVDLKFDLNNTAHIIFTDIASSHANMNYLNLGNIRHAFKSENEWNISTIYRQNLPTAFFNAEEIYDMCLVISAEPFMLNVIAQELNVSAYNDYNVELIKIPVEYSNSIHEITIPKFQLDNYPNPFQQQTHFKFSTNDDFDHFQLDIYNLKGQKIKHFDINSLDKKHCEVSWDIHSDDNKNLSSGIYFAVLRSNKDILAIKKCLLIK